MQFKLKHGCEGCGLASLLKLSKKIKLASIKCYVIIGFRWP